ncbi:MAG: sigma-54-dependent Fis family transcriptional regulator [Deltaproteobacteria bacterium]|nr:sigma-54-dependent Fis family transcriptional regulator [Deltaproteobacteria bacterium]
MPPTILVVDDEPTILTAIEGILSDEGFEMSAALDGQEALDKVEESMPDLVLLDIWLPNLDGLEVLERLKADYPHLPVVMMSGASTIETAVKATRLGAFDYIEKPLSYEKIVVTLNNALSFSQLAEANLLLRQKARPRVGLTGESPAIEDLKKQISLVAPTSAWVLITGDNGTGKEVVAHAVHAQSPRADRPMIEVNCAAIPEELIESELFGHEKGSFTGATERKQGKFDLAHRGTIFLDEIADMSLKTQAKILRILQERKFVRVGGTRTISVDVRVIAASNRNLEAEIKKGSFREDLYYRLNVIPLHLPPLRERSQDVPLLAAEFLEEFARKTNTELKTLSPRALEALKAHSWPGNVRELRNLMERLVILTPGREIRLKDLPQPFRGESLGPGQAEAMAEPGLREARAAFERAFIAARLAKFEGNISATAESLGIERSHLHKKIKVLGVKL